MADIGKTKEFMNLVKEVRNEYPEDSIERKIPISFVATVAATETGNFQFKDAPTAKAANNFFGMHADSNYMKQNPKGFLTTTGGANLRKFADSKESIRGFLQLITTSDRYKPVIDSSDKSVSISSLFSFLVINIMNKYIVFYLISSLKYLH